MADAVDPKAKGIKKQKIENVLKEDIKPPALFYPLTHLVIIVNCVAARTLDQVFFKNGRYLAHLAV